MCVCVRVCVCVCVLACTYYYSLEVKLANMANLSDLDDETRDRMLNLLPVLRKVWENAFSLCACMWVWISRTYAHTHTHTHAHVYYTRGITYAVHLWI